MLIVAGYWNELFTSEPGSWLGMRSIHFLGLVSRRICMFFCWLSFVGTHTDVGVRFGEFETGTGENAPGGRCV